MSYPTTFNHTSKLVPEEVFSLDFVERRVFASSQTPGLCHHTDLMPRISRAQRSPYRPCPIVAASISHDFQSLLRTRLKGGFQLNLVGRLMFSCFPAPPTVPHLFFTPCIFPYSKLPLLSLARIHTLHPMISEHGLQLNLIEVFVDISSDVVCLLDCFFLPFLGLSASFVGRRRYFVHDAKTGSEIDSSIEVRGPVIWIRCGKGGIRE